MRALLIFIAGAICGAVLVYVMMLPMSRRSGSAHDDTPSVLQAPASPSVPAVPAEPPRTPPAATPSPAPAATEPPASALVVPVEGITADRLSDTFDQARAQGRRHDAIDIMAPRGTRVLAAADGTVVKLFTSVRGGLTVYVFDPTATIEYYYAHLDGYAPGLAEGMALRRGDPIGFVGSTGDAAADAPHLHFEIAVLGPQKHWWQATDINPYPVLTGQQTLQQAIAASELANASNGTTMPPQ